MFLESAVTLLLVAAANPNPWNELKNVDGIRLFAREVPGSSIREIKAETVIPAAAEKIWAVINDQPHYPEFMPYIVGVELLTDDAGPNARYEYHQIDPPIVDRRDYTLKATFETDAGAGRYRRSWSAANDKGPAPKDGVVRVSVVDGYWLIERVTAESSRVTYWLHTDPGGSIPSWMANKANKKSIPNMIRAVRSRSLDPNWKRD